MWLTNTHNGIKGKVERIYIEDYPAVKKWLDTGGIAYNGKLYEGFHQIAKRADQGDTPYNLRNCAYWEDFSKPKLIYPETTQGAYFAYDDTGLYIDKTCFMLISSYAKYIQHTLSSHLFEFAYKRIFSSVELGEKGYQYNKHALIKLPIMKPKSYMHFDEHKIDECIYQLYGITSEEQREIENYF